MRDNPVLLKVLGLQEETMPSNVVEISRETFRQRAAKASIEDAFGFGHEIEEMKKQIISDALLLAPYLNGRELGKFVTELGFQMHKVRGAK